MQEQQKSWTERDHWTVMARDRGEEERCIGHFEHEKDARACAARARSRYDNVRVNRTDRA